MGPHSILTTIADPTTSALELRIYSEYIAGKINSFLKATIKSRQRYQKLLESYQKEEKGNYQKDNSHQN